MMEILDMSRKIRGGNATGIAGFPGSNIISANNGARFRQSIRHENAAFMAARGHH